MILEKSRGGVTEREGDLGKEEKSQEGGGWFLEKEKSWEIF